MFLWISGFFCKISCTGLLVLRSLPGHGQLERGSPIRQIHGGSLVCQVHLSTHTSLMHVAGSCGHIMSVSGSDKPSFLVSSAGQQTDRKTSPEDYFLLPRISFLNNHELRMLYVSAHLRTTVGAITCQPPVLFIQAVNGGLGSSH